MGRYNLYTDLELFGLMKVDDRGAFAELYGRYHADIVRFLRKFLKSSNLSEDICQNVFLKCWEGRSELPETIAPASWLYTVAKSRALDFLRRVSVEQAAASMILNEYPTGRNLPEENQFTRDYLAFIEKILDTMPERTREVFKLCRQQYLTYEEAAVQLGITHHTVKKHMGYSMRILKRAVDKELGIDLKILLAALMLTLH
ncbi:RNA polymerase sigma factor [Pararcticibacter amylolyticus]|uniref:RNA polymerase subunit sigma-70 n=1 Tax=Pararcticibacter amylolyticus TaxID=2173175 RepID=A0A2U2PIL7_9SPHI|nr:sigma-70 family RNA polymerase sigma factor [Pararcticibacter amylolyticus]PWG81220.1 RNA polymerase subunit sigma-70 [Pararcticibacter amylolyticus]